MILEVGGGERFALRVVDDGPGIPADELCQLVDRGFRGNDARTRSPDGQGLGLNIALRVAELHRFTLRFSASEYGGLQVWRVAGRSPHRRSGGRGGSRAAFGFPVSWDFGPSSG